MGFGVGFVGFGGLNTLLCLEPGVYMVTCSSQIKHMQICGKQGKHQQNYGHPVVLLRATHVPLVVGLRNFDV